jgi:hypothetical protein
VLLGPPPDWRKVGSVSSTALAVRQTRIFAPPRPPYDDGDPRSHSWSDTLLGRVVAELAQDPALGWFWFSRYSDAPGGDDGDCDVSQLPDSYLWRVRGVGVQHRSVRFRYALLLDEVARFETAAGPAIAEAGAHITDFRDYAWVDDLASPRFLGDGATDTTPARRAELMVQFLHATARLALDCLDGPDADGRYRPEGNSMMGSSLRTPLHLFWNATLVPVVVPVDGQLVRLASL